ncbi:acetyltransferase [Streptococcus uberis]|nr:acetyltransferase [Streptococcus uberis]
MFKYNDQEDTIETDRLVLRKFTLDDSQTVTRICSTDAIQKNTLNLPNPYTEESAIEWIMSQGENSKQNKSYDYAITDKLTGNLYGCVSLAVFKNGYIAELGYWISPDTWNKGIATEAATALIRFGFEMKQFHKIVAKHFKYNGASGRVMEKAGMTKEGLQKKHVLKNNKYEDSVLYGISNPLDS